MTIKKGSIIRYIYLYLVTAITIVLIIISTIGLVNLVLKEYVFDVKSWEEIDRYWECDEDTLFYSYDKQGNKLLLDPNITEEQMITRKADCVEQTEKDREFRHVNDLKRDLVTWLSMLLVSLPLYLYHWGIIKKESKK